MKVIDKLLENSSNKSIQIKADLIQNYCPDCFNLANKCNENPRRYKRTKCIECWNSEVEEDKKNDKMELTFENLEKSPIKGIELANSSELNLLESLNNDDFIISDNGYITYENLPQFIKWCQDVYDLATELKKKAIYVDFSRAKNHMRNGNKAKFKELTYWIENDEFYFDFYSEPKTVELSLAMIESNEWILL